MAVVLLHSYANPANEEAVARAVRSVWPNAHVSVSSEILPEIREFERSSTTVLNAAVQPVIDRYLRDVEKKLVAVEHTRDISKKSMIHNGATPKIEIDPETYEVTADGELLTCEPAETLPMAQRYFLF